MPKKPLNARQTLSAELRVLTRLGTADKREAEKAMAQLLKERDTKMSRLATAEANARRAVTTAATQRNALFARAENAATALAKQHATKNKRRLQRIAIIESRLAAL
jgi:hypothetical protein